MINLRDRIVLLKNGYSKKEIEELAKAEVEAIIENEKEQSEEVENEKALDKEKVLDNDKASSEEFMKTINNLVDEVKELKTSIHQQNINKTEIVDKRQEAEEILASIINPLKNKEE